MLAKEEYGENSMKFRKVLVEHYVRGMHSIGSYYRARRDWMRVSQIQMEMASLAIRFLNDLSQVNVRRLVDVIQIGGEEKDNAIRLLIGIVGEEDIVGVVREFLREQVFGEHHNDVFDANLASVDSVMDFLDEWIGRMIFWVNGEEGTFGGAEKHEFTLWHERGHFDSSLLRMKIEELERATRLGAKERLRTQQQLLKGSSLRRMGDTTSQQKRQDSRQNLNMRVSTQSERLNKPSDETIRGGKPTENSPPQQDDATHLPPQSFSLDMDDTSSEDQQRLASIQDYFESYNPIIKESAFKALDLVASWYESQEKRQRAAHVRYRQALLYETFCSWEKRARQYQGLVQGEDSKSLRMPHDDIWKGMHLLSITERKQYLSSLHDTLRCDPTYERAVDKLEKHYLLERSKKESSDLSGIMFLLHTQLRHILATEDVLIDRQKQLFFKPLQLAVQSIEHLNKQVQTLQDCTVGRRFEYQYDFDRNGVLWYLGFQNVPLQDWKEDDSVWRNPCLDGSVLVRTGGGQSDADNPKNPEPEGKANTAKPNQKNEITKPENFLSRRPVVNGHVDAINSYFCVSFQDYEISPTHYTLRHGNEVARGALRNWVLEAKVGADSWVILKEHLEDSSLNSGFATHTWELDDVRQYFGDFRVRITGANSGGRYFIDVGGFELYGILKRRGDLSI